ncbi:MAG: hypothetical protein COA62_14490 [Rhodobiaceae bacterium]|nr:MAG: hypothetical protein COA62_14490 [Rhodobiaceae bacterium]
MKCDLIAVAFVSAAVLVSPAGAAAILETAIGNTVSATTDGIETRYYSNENGSVSLANSKGLSDIGTWSTSAGNLCMSWAAAEAPVCISVNDQQAVFVHGKVRRRVVMDAHS